MKTVDELMRLVYFIAGNYHLAEGAQAPVEREKHDLLYREQVAALRSALEEVVANDRRYRWLITSPDAAFFSFEGMCCRNEPKADIDAAIDAAMHQASEQEG